MNANRLLKKRAGLIVAAIVATMVSANVLRAQDVAKANNTTNLIDGASWVGGNALTSSNIAVWNSTVTAANTPDLGGNLSIAGIKITNPGGAIGISSGTVNSGAVTASSTADTFTYTGTDLVNGNIVTFSGTTMPGGIANSRPYFVVNVNTTAKTYQVSDTAGGAAIDLTSTGSSLTNTARYALTIGSSGINLSSATQSLASLSAPVSLSAAQTWTTGSNRSIDSNGNSNNAGVGILNNGYQLEIDGAGRTEIGYIAGTGGLVKNGSGTLVLYAGAFSGNIPYTFSGNVSLNSGSVIVSTNNQTGATLLGVGASELTLGNVSVSFSTNSATQNFDRNTTVTGNASLTIQALPYRFGTLAIGPYTLSTLTSNTTTDSSLTYGATTLTGNATFSLGTRSNNFLVLGAVGESGGSRGFTKSGVGTLTIAGSSTYTGTTTISGGSLKLDTNGSFANSPRIVVGDAGSSGASLDLTAKTGTFTFGAGQTIGGIGTITIGDGKTVQSQGIWAPGNSIGANAVTGNLALSGTSQFELGTPGSNATSPGTSDFTAVSGTLTLGGNLTLLDNSGSSSQGSYGAGSYRLFAAPAVSGTFASVTAPAGASSTRVGMVYTSGTSSGQGIFANVYNLATGGVVSGTALNLGVIHAGASFGAQTLSIANTAAAGSFSEGLNASVSGSTGDATSGGTAITNLAAGGTAGTITVSLGDTSLGVKTGSITIDYQSNGSATSGLPTISAGSQTVSLTGSVYSGQSTWAIDGGGNWGTLSGTGASAFGSNWGTNQGSPGLDASFANTDTATFGSALTTAGGTAAINTAGANISLKSLTFDNANGSYEIYQTGGSGALTLLAAGMNSAGITVSAGSHAIHADVTLGSSTVIDVASGAALTLHNAISGSAAFGLTKTGSGTLYFAGNNGGYAGNTDIQGGLVRLLSGVSPLGTGTVTVRSGATLDLNNLSLSNSLNVLSGGILLNTGSGQNVSVTTAVTFSGTTNGTLSIDTGGSATFEATVGGAVTVGNGGAATFTSAAPLTGSLDVLSGGVVHFSGSNTAGSTFNVASGGLVNVNSAASLGGQLHVSGSAVIAGAVASNADVVVQSDGMVKLIDGASFAQTSLTNAGRFVIDRTSALTLATAISGSGSLQKTGAGKLTLTGSSSYSGGTTVEGGILSVNGQIGGNATVLSGGTLGGSGSVGGVLSGAGLVSPGNSPGILTASQFDPSGGLDAAFEFTALAPVYTSATASLNDVMRLTNLSNPFASGTFTAGNVIDIYFNVGSIASGQVYEGGFFTGLSAEALLAALDGKATFHYWAKTTGTSVERSFNGFDYVSLTSLSGITGATFKTATRTADFGGGDVTGSVTQFVIIPEPDTVIFAGIGIAMAGWSLWKRRRRTP